MKLKKSLGGKLNKNAVPLNYIKQQLGVGFTLEFIAKDLGIDLESLKRRILRAKRRGEW
jgi:hypothetical protein